MVLGGLQRKPLYSGISLDIVAFSYLCFLLLFPCGICGLAFPR